MWGVLGGGHVFVGLCVCVCVGLCVCDYNTDMCVYTDAKRTVRL